MSIMLVQEEGGGAWGMWKGAFFVKLVVGFGEDGSDEAPPTTGSE